VTDRRLVVAADDGVMPQTIEAIDYAKAAKVAIVVASTRSTRLTPARSGVKTELSEHGVVIGSTAATRRGAVSGTHTRGHRRPHRHDQIVADVQG
jgi:hypothetical protein